jgi:hypothetical protein
VSIAVTIDLDWACEPAIAELLDFLQDREIPSTVFVTHRSPRVERSLHELEVGLHPNFAADSSHGETLNAVVEHVLGLPHNIPAYRCHRFAASNEISERLASVGMKFASNICTDLDATPPFRDRCGVLQFPVFLEDGAYLLRAHPLSLDSALWGQVAAPGLHVLLIHPMHFALNSPTFMFMRTFKDSLSRAEWLSLSAETLAAQRHRGPGIRDVLAGLLEHAKREGLRFTTLGTEYNTREALSAR